MFFSSHFYIVSRLYLSFLDFNQLYFVFLSCFYRLIPINREHFHPQNSNTIHNVTHKQIKEEEEEEKQQIDCNKDRIKREIKSLRQGKIHSSVLIKYSYPN